MKEVYIVSCIITLLGILLVISGAGLPRKENSLNEDRVSFYFYTFMGLSHRLKLYYYSLVPELSKIVQEYESSPAITKDIL